MQMYSTFSGEKPPPLHIDPPLACGVPDSQAQLMLTMQRLCTRVEDMRKVQVTTNTALFAGMDNTGRVKITDNPPRILRASTISDKVVIRKENFQSTTTLVETMN